MYSRFSYYLSSVIYSPSLDEVNNIFCFIAYNLATFIKLNLSRIIIMCIIYTQELMSRPKGVQLRTIACNGLFSEQLAHLPFME